MADIGALSLIGPIRNARPASGRLKLLSSRRQVAYTEPYRIVDTELDADSLRVIRGFLGTLGFSVEAAHVARKPTDAEPARASQLDVLGV